MGRALRTLFQSLLTPVITTSLYFVVFGAAIVRCTMCPTGRSSCPD
jgi:hypothetical protein